MFKVIKRRQQHPPGQISAAAEQDECKPIVLRSAHHRLSQAFDLIPIRDSVVKALDEYKTFLPFVPTPQQILPGGVDSPVRAFKSVGAPPLFIRRASGARLEDVDGNRFIDYVMSWGPLIHGHAPRAWSKRSPRREKLARATARPVRSKSTLASACAKLMPSLERVRFVSSGTEATMSAIRVARPRPAATRSSSSKVVTTGTRTVSRSSADRAR